MTKIIRMVENAPITNIGGLKELAENAGKKLSETSKVIHDPKPTLEHTPDWVGRDLVKPMVHNEIPAYTQTIK